MYICIVEYIKLNIPILVVNILTNIYANIDYKSKNIKNLCSYNTLLLILDT